MSPTPASCFWLHGAVTVAPTPAHDGHLHISVQSRGGEGVAVNIWTTRPHIGCCPAQKGLQRVSLMEQAGGTGGRGTAWPAALGTGCRGPARPLIWPHHTGSRVPHSSLAGEEQVGGEGTTESHKKGRLRGIQVQTPPRRAGAGGEPCEGEAFVSLEGKQPSVCLSSSSSPAAAPGQAEWAHSLRESSGQAWKTRNPLMQFSEEGQRGEMLGWEVAFHTGLSPRLQGVGDPKAGTQRQRLLEEGTTVQRPWGRAGLEN